MDALVISISADSSKESVRSSISLIILLDSDTETKTLIIPTDIHAIIPIVPPIALEVEAAIVASPASVLDLVIHSDTETDPSKDPSSPEHAPFSPGVSPFYDSNPDSESEFSGIHSSPDPQETAVARWRARVMARSSSSNPLSSSPILVPPIEIAATPVIPAPSTEVIVTLPALPTSPSKATVALSDVPTAPVHITTVPATGTTPTPCLTDDCSSSKRFSYSSSDTARTPLGPSPRRRPQCSDYVTPSSSSSVGMSRKRRVHHYYEFSIEDSTKMGYDDSMEADSEANIGVDIEADMYADIETDIDTDIQADIEAYIMTEVVAPIEADVEPAIEADTETGAKADVEANTEVDDEDSVRDTMEIAVDFVTEPVVPNDLPVLIVRERLDEHEEAIHGMYEHLTEIPTQRLEDIEEEQRAQKVRAVTADTERDNLIERVMALEAKELRQIRLSHHYDREFQEARDFHDQASRISSIELRQDLCYQLEYHSITILLLILTIMSTTQFRETPTQGMTTKAIKKLITQHVTEALAKQGNQNGNGNKNGNRNETNEGEQRVAPVSKFATCTLLDGALTWWNSHVKTIGIDEVYGMSWKKLMKLMIEVYCPRNEIQKLENELWNLSMKGTDVAGYTRQF
ncbi:reverse transcriptase domain-containing protein [Tanacetum coccineum]